ncbi:MAG: DNA repair protein RecO [Patescibacteria group bacterium]
MGTYYVRGIILMHQDFREADRLITVYTEEYGKLRLLARGVRKVSSKLAGNLEPYALARLHVVRGRRYDTVAASDVEKTFNGIRRDLKRTYLAAYFSSVVEYAVPGSVRDAGIYALIRQAFSTLEHATTNPVRRMKLVWFFVWQLLAHVGYGPELQACLACRKKLRPAVHTFSFTRGGIVCTACSEGPSGADAKIRPNAIKALRIVCRGRWQDAVRLRTGADTARELTSLTEAYLSFILERPLPLTQFFAPE